MIDFLRLVCQVIGALVLLGWAVVILGFLLAIASIHVERERKRRQLSICPSCGEPQQGGYCQNCWDTWSRTPSDAEIVERLLGSIEHR